MPGAKVPVVVSAVVEVLLVVVSAVWLAGAELVSIVMMGTFCETVSIDSGSCGGGSTLSRAVALAGGRLWTLRMAEVGQLLVVHSSGSMGGVMRVASMPCTLALR